MKALDKDIMLKINCIVDEAQEFFLEGKYNSSIKKYKKALALIPEPKTGWIESWSLFYGIGEIYFQNGNFEEALEYFRQSLYCPHGLGNPHIHLRIGQIRYEFKQIDKAKDELMRAYMGGDVEIFKGEQRKYFDLIEPYINRSV